MSGIEVLVVTANRATREAVLKPWVDGKVHVSSSITEGMQLLDSVGIDVVALDYNGKLENLQFALNDIRELSPTAALIVFCTKRQVQEVTESEIGNSIFQIIPKPLTAKQPLLAFNSAYTNHLALASREPVGEELPIVRSPKEYISQLKYLLLVSLVAFIAWFTYKLLGIDNPEETPTIATPVENTQESTASPLPTNATPDDSSENLADESVDVLPDDPELAGIDVALDQSMLPESQTIGAISDTAEDISPPLQAAITTTSPVEEVAGLASKITPAVKISGRNPRYPKNAQRRGIEGYIDLEFTITQIGEVTSVTIMQAEPQGVFNTAAIAAVASWRYQPRLINDQPVSERKQIRLRFRL